jgi:ribosomal protein L11 methylase PrmA
MSSANPGRGENAAGSRQAHDDPRSPLALHTVDFLLYLDMGATISYRSFILVLLAFRIISNYSLFRLVVAFNAGGCLRTSTVPRVFRPFSQKHKIYDFFNHLHHPWLVMVSTGSASSLNRGRSWFSKPIRNMFETDEPESSFSVDEFEDMNKPYDLIIDTELIATTDQKAANIDWQDVKFVDGQQLSDYLLEVFGAQTVTITRRKNADVQSDNLYTSEHDENIFGEPNVDYSKDIASATEYRNFRSIHGLLDKVAKVWKDAVVVARIAPYNNVSPEDIVQTLEDLLELSSEYRLNYRISPTIGEEKEASIDWCAHVQKTWTPSVIIGGHINLVIAFPFHTEQSCDKAIQDAISSSSSLSRSSCFDKIILEGGAAFGTGDHPTTAMCSEWLIHEVSSWFHTQDSKLLNAPDESDSSLLHVMDYGSGSGILGIVAFVTSQRQRLLQNCSMGDNYSVKVDAVEVDLTAIMSARRNILLNHIPHNVINFYTPMKGTPGWFEEESVTEDVTSLPLDRKQSYHLVVANIMSQPLIELSKTLSLLAKKNVGKIGLSGIMIHQVDAVMDAYGPFFDKLKVTQEKNGWVLLEGQRNNNDIA